MWTANDISKTKLANFAKEIMKWHPLMDGSGRLYLLDPKKLSEKQIEDVIAFVHRGLSEQGIDDQLASTVNSLVEGTLRQIEKRRPPRKGRLAKGRDESQMIEMQKQIGNLAKKKT